MPAVTLASAGGTQSIVATPTISTLATKGLTAGNYISLSSDANSITISADQYQTIDSICRVNLTSSASVSNGATITLSFTTETLDPTGMHSNTTNPERINILEDGIYLIILHAAWWSANPSTTGIIQNTIQLVSGGPTIAQESQAVTSSEEQSINCAGVVPLSMGDAVIATATNNSGVSRSVLAPTTTLSVTKIGVL
jgi:hypothetical protein